MLLLSRSAGPARALPATRESSKPRSRPVALARYRKDAGGGGAGDCGDVVLYTSRDPVNGGPCPYSQAVIIALLEKKVPFKEVKVDPSNKTEQFTDLYHSIIPDLEERVRVPLLVCNAGQRLVDSATIVDFLAAAFPDSGTPLTPPDAYTAARVKLFTRYFNDHVVPAHNRLIHASGDAAVAAARDELFRALAAVDEFLALHGAGEGDYALGPHYGWSMSSQDAREGQQDQFFLGPYYTTAEVMATPFVARMVEVLPEWRGIDVLAECEQLRLRRVAGWMRACLSRPSAKLTSPKRKELVDGLVEWEWSHAL